MMIIAPPSLSLASHHITLVLEAITCESHMTPICVTKTLPSLHRSRKLLMHVFPVKFHWYMVFREYIIIIIIYVGPTTFIYRAQCIYKHESFIWGKTKFMKCVPKGFYYIFDCYIHLSIVNRILDCQTSQLGV